MTVPHSSCCASRLFFLFFFFLFFFCGPRCTHTAPDFSYYLHSILKTHTVHTCEGSTLSIRCPSRTSVSVLSAFYGRRVPSQHLCPSADSNATVDEDTACSSSIAVQKVLSECQDRRSCHIPVFNPVFGPDPCPMTSKYLLVSYKCRPEQHHTRLVCENERLRLSCKNDTVLLIYSATFGHLLHGSPFCPQEPPESRTDMECLSPLALRKVSRRCHGRSNCSVLADIQTFGEPCFPGTRKHLRVSFTCVPQYLLEDMDRGSSDPFLISDGLPEKVALYFVSGICAGLVFLLCLFGIRSTLVKDVREVVSDLKDELRKNQRRRRELIEDLYEDQISDTSSFCRLTKSKRSEDIFSPSILTVEMLERGNAEQMRELPNGDMWPHGDSSPYSITTMINYNK
ncbi:protein eva-1 homolog C isoform X2 [Cynoglossus semilaevis]|uniref:Si:ch73-335m24.2 n=1 Tax=Cynoglossus semilaevis TaxID=244447 RepID=A0A3P8USQ4_CYNSE|nr:protein eva-1 homolog C-like isoform X2 [Cynoglossus semilaevis]